MAPRRGPDTDVMPAPLAGRRTPPRPLSGRWHGSC